jgi:hypothetical protein
VERGRTVDSSTLSTRLRGHGPLAALALAGCLNTDAQVNATFGDTLMDTLAEPPGDNCPEGGIQIRLGPDRNANGTLDPDEVTQQEFLCTGAGGGAPLTVATDEPPGDNYANGGTRLDVGNDANGDGLLGADEITETVYLCDDATAGGFQEPARVVTGARRSCAIRAGGAPLGSSPQIAVALTRSRSTKVPRAGLLGRGLLRHQPPGALTAYPRPETAHGAPQRSAVELTPDEGSVLSPVPVLTVAEYGATNASAGLAR